MSQEKPRICASVAFTHRMASSISSNQLNHRDHKCPCFRRIPAASIRRLKIPRHFRRFGFLGLHNVFPYFLTPVTSHPLRAGPFYRSISRMIMSL
jgi:hypothetical protein